MPGLRPDVDPDGLLEYSVVYTDRALNHMSDRFAGALREVSATLKEVYGARSAIVVPGSGTSGMEAVARQFARDQRCLVLRNGWFSYRWSQIFDMAGMAAGTVVLKARRTADSAQAPIAPFAPFAPPTLAQAQAAIREARPGVVIAPHVETSAGLMLPDDYLHGLADAAHEVGALFVLDAIASGAVWVDMAAVGVDVLVTAPQKCWSAPPGCGLVMLSPAARDRIDATTSNSFALDLKKWLAIMETYEAGGVAYHATPPTDSLLVLRDAMRETRAMGFAAARAAQFELGHRVRGMLAARGAASVAAPGFEAPGVVVAYAPRADWHDASAFKAQGLQIAGGVPLALDEGPDFRSFRIGLFGIDKLRNVEQTAATFARALAAITG